MNKPTLSRRQFGFAVGALPVVLPAAAAIAEDRSASPSGGDSTPQIYKAVKWGMIGGDGSVTDKFELCKEIGYDGMELESPHAALDLEKVRVAADATGMPVHGVVDMRHWQDRLSSPDEKVRDRGRGYLEQAIRDSHAWGGDTVLLVPGRVAGENETHDHVWDRSITEIRKVLPLASKLGVRILIENVWNGFCETPEQLRDYLDAIDSPWVGSYFDIGNVRKFSPPEEWIRTLGARIVKLDVKDWGRENGFCKIGDGDVDWPAVREALAEIGYHGWATAEVGGGGRERLAEIADRMDRNLIDP